MRKFKSIGAKWLILGGSVLIAMIPISVILGINKTYNKIRGVMKK